MLANPPDGFEYVVTDYQAVPTSSSSTLKRFLETLRWNISPYYNQFKIITGSPKIRSFQTTCDVVHSAQSPLNTNVPYVMDFEHAAVFAGYNQSAFQNRKFVQNLRKILENPNLKKLLSWSNAAKLTLFDAVPSEIIEAKVETVYPVITPPEKLEKKDDSSIRFLFIGGNFYEKGGLETLHAFDQISQKYASNLTMISPVPESIRAQFSKNKKIKIESRVAYEEVKKLYATSHVFVMPTHMDTFGFVIPEALSYGLPVIAEDSFSRPELIAHGKTGLLVKSYYSCFGKNGEYIYKTNKELNIKRRLACMNPPEWCIKELADAMERMISDSKLRDTCSKNARKETTEGTFSSLVWKKTMKRIYEEAIR